MKLTLHIDDNIAPALIQALASLLAREAEPVADPCPGHPELPLMPLESAVFAKTAQVGMTEAVNSAVANWIAAGGDVPPTPEQLAALAAPTRHIESVPVASVPDDEDPALADVRWQATPEPTPEPDPWDEQKSINPWDVPAPTDAEPVGFAAGTDGKLEVVALDETNPDLTQRVLAWPQELLSIALPEHPEGKTRWVYRGTFDTDKIEANGRAVFYHDEGKWCPTCHFSTCFHHIEAI